MSLILLVSSIAYALKMINQLQRHSAIRPEVVIIKDIAANNKLLKPQFLMFQTPNWHQNVYECFCLHVKLRLSIMPNAPERNGDGKGWEKNSRCTGRT